MYYKLFTNFYLARYLNNYSISQNFKQDLIENIFLINFNFIQYSKVWLFDWFFLYF